MSWLSGHLENATKRLSIFIFWGHRKKSQLSNKTNSSTGHTLSSEIKDDSSLNLSLEHQAFCLASSSVVHGQAAVLFSDQISYLHSEWRGRVGPLGCSLAELALCLPPGNQHSNTSLLPGHSSSHWDNLFFDCQLLRDDSIKGMKLFILE